MKNCRYANCVSYRPAESCGICAYRVLKEGGKTFNDELIRPFCTKADDFVNDDYVCDSFEVPFVDDVCDNFETPE